MLDFILSRNQVSRRQTEYYSSTLPEIGNHGQLYVVQCHVHVHDIVLVLVAVGNYCGTMYLLR